MGTGSRCYCRGVLALIPSSWALTLEIWGFPVDSPVGNLETRWKTVRCPLGNGDIIELFILAFWEISTTNARQARYPGHHMNPLEARAFPGLTRKHFYLSLGFSEWLQASEGVRSETAFERQITQELKSYLVHQLGGWSDGLPGNSNSLAHKGWPGIFWEIWVLPANRTKNLNPLLFVWEFCKSGNRKSGTVELVDLSGPVWLRLDQRHLTHIGEYSPCGGLQHSSSHGRSL